MSAPPSEPRGTEVGLSFGRVYRAFVFAAAVCVVVAGVQAISSVLAPVLVSLFLSGIVLAPLRWFRRRGMGKLAASVLTAALVLGATALLVFFVTRWVNELQALWPDYRDRLNELLQRAGAWLEQLGLHASPRIAADAIDFAALTNLTGSVVRVLTGIVSVLLLTGFVLADLLALPAKLESTLRGKPHVQAIARNTTTRLMTYFRVKTGTSLATGVAAGIACAGVGLDLPLLWGFLAFALNYVTTIGSFVAAVPPILLAAAVEGTQAFFLLLTAYVVINVVIGAILEPNLLGDSMGLSPLIVLLSLAFWGWVLGPIGFLLAVPITMLLKLVFEETDELRPLALVLGTRRQARASEARQRAGVVPASLGDPTDPIPAVAYRVEPPTAAG